jgi:hypothetical protein
MANLDPPSEILFPSEMEHSVLSVIVNFKRIIGKDVKLKMPNN